MFKRKRKRAKRKSKAKSKNYSRSTQVPTYVTSLKKRKMGKVKINL